MVNNKSKRIQLSGTRKPQIERNRSLNMYYRDIRPYKPLSQEETKELFKLYHNGTKEERDFAFNKICKHNMRLVVSLARDYCSSEDNINDLIQEGNIGLIRAIDMFDEENGTSFAGYSMYWIRRYINIFKTNTTPIVSQTNRSKTTNPIVTITNELLQSLERVPTPEEILDEYNLRYPNKPIKDSEDVVNVEYVYIDQLLSDTNQDAQSYNEYCSASEAYNDYSYEIENEYNKEMVSCLLNGLTEKETKAIRMIYGLDNGIETSISVIGSEMHVSNQRIHKLHKTALNKMRKKVMQYQIRK